MLDPGRCASSSFHTTVAYFNSAPQNGGPFANKGFGCRETDSSYSSGDREDLVGEPYLDIEDRTGKMSDNALTFKRAAIAVDAIRSQFTKFSLTSISIYM